ncbi:MAG: valyl-tRNA synthetase, partial [Parcubacteria group bacterium Gr01-1014_38]
RGERIINWCPRCASSISDLEVRHEDREETVYFIKYPIAESQRHITVATARPETIFGDTAVAVDPHPPKPAEDHRDLLGASVVVPLAGRTVPVIADAAARGGLFTGALKVTPAHDHTDAAIAERHHLPVKNVIGEDGRLTEQVPAPYRGLTVEQARQKVVADLRSQGFLDKEAPIDHSVPLCDRCGTVIQPLVSKQWFVSMAPLAKPALEVVERALIAFHPPRWKNASVDWLHRVRDWCISRQLWWGHRMPVWYCSDDGEVAASDDEFVFSLSEPKKCRKCERTKFLQDPDVLDTWFSSALWPFAVFGWPEATADLRRFYPTSVLVTDKGILNLWVARMIFSGLEFMNPAKFLPARVFGSRSPTKQIPFHTVIVHPTVLNLKGQRMSKSLGTGVDPMELIREFGADATRFGLLLQSQDDQQALRFDPNAVRTGRNFVNKLWNITRFAQTAQRKRAVGGHGPRLFDLWILRRRQETIRAVTDALETFRFGDALRLLHDFLWDDLADWYVEVSKVPGMTTPRVLHDVLRDALKLLHPFLPFVTEERWKTFGDEGMLIAATWPSAARRGTSSRASAAAATQVRRFQQIVRGFRSARTLLGLPASRAPRIRIRGAGVPLELFPAIEFLAHCRIDGGNGDWVHALASGSCTLEVLREDLAGVDVAARRSAVEQRAAALRQQVQELERRVNAMRGRAPIPAIAETEALLVSRRAELAEHEQSLTTLHSLAGRPPSSRNR